MPGIPFNTTRVLVQRFPSNEDVLVDAYDGPPDFIPDPIAKVVGSLRAVISTPSINTQLSTGTKVIYNAEMRTDVADIQTLDQITDQKTGRVWQCLNTIIQSAFGMSFMISSLRSVEGET